jgi:phosphate-selective porin
MKAYLLLLLLLVGSAYAQEQGTSVSEMQKVVNDTLANKWYEKLQLKGYAQFRYNRLLETNRNLTNPSNDKSIGNNKGFFLRRARLTLFGEVSDRVYVYIQPDFAQDAGTTAGQNYFQIRDAYFDYALSDNKEWRLRTGISKVPFTFDNLQSSSNRAPLDRSDAMNTGAPNERDTGVFLMYAPTDIRKHFKDLTSNNLKGTGDYGMIALGAYNGQTLNKGEENNDLHRAVRFTYPVKLTSGQYIEASLQAYEGQYAISGKDYYDQRTAASFIVYPQPFGFQVEYTTGQGPEYDDATGTVKTEKLEGGYAMVNYQTSWRNQRFFPYVRYQEYDGGRKLDNGNHMITQDWEFGSEWQPNAALEITVAYVISDRIVESATANQNLDKNGQLLRFQAQFNY